MRHLLAGTLIALMLLFAAQTPVFAQQDTVFTPEELQELMQRSSSNHPSIGTAPSDTGSVTVRSFKPAQLQAFREDEAFRYERETAKKVGWWDRFWYWLDDLFSGVLDTPTKQHNFRWIIYTFAVIVVGYSVLKMFGVNLYTLFYKKSAISSIRSELTNENIHEINFEDELKKAIVQHDYRTAIRLYYLLSLKKLSDRNLIAWEINKTNLDYTRELGRTQLRNDFEQITYFFEYVCYGHFDVDAHTFDHALVLFKNFDQKIGR